MSTHSALLGILGAFTVPIVVFSVKLLGQFQQLHPQVVDRGGLVEPLFRSTMWTTALGLVLLQFFLIWLRWRIGVLESEGRH